MKKLFLLFCLLLIFSNCNNSVDSSQNSCEQKIIVDNELYANAPNDSFVFRNVEIYGDCLSITIEYGGGCGKVEIKLIDSGVIAESNPVQRNVRVSFKDEDSCKALITKKVSFDLTPIRVVGDNKVFLNISNWSGGGVIYIY